MINDEQFLKQAIELARQARTDGNHPFGALLVLDGRVVLTARNTVNTEQNPTAHAEHNLVGKAIRQFSQDQIARCVLYASCEPCAMCVGANVLGRHPLDGLWTPGRDAGDAGGAGLSHRLPRVVPPGIEHRSGEGTPARRRGARRPPRLLVATVVIARWDDALDLAHARRVLAGDQPEQIATLPEAVAPAPR